MDAPHFAAALTLAALSAGVAVAAEKPATAKQTAFKQCHGVSFAVQNDCKAGEDTTCAGRSTSGYQSHDLRNVRAGICTSVKTPKDTGSLKEFYSCSRRRYP